MSPSALGFLPDRAGGPAGAFGDGVDEIDRAGILEIAQPVFDRIDAGLGGEFVDIGFVGKGIRQCRDAAKPRCAHDRRHVVRHHAHGVVIVRRDRGAVAHLEHGRDRRNRSGQQQRQGRRAVGRIARGKIVTGDAAVGVQSAIDVHQLRGAFRLPGVLLLAGQLHADGTADRARQQNRVGRNVIGAVAAIAAGGLQPDHLDFGFRPLQQQREVGAQDVRILRAGPHPDVAVLIIRDRAGRADRTVHLVRPDISPLHRSCGGRDGGVDVALVDQGARRRWIGAQRGLDVLQVRQCRGRLPAHLELRRRLDRVFLALGETPTKSPILTTATSPGMSRDRGLVDRDQAGADEGAGIDAGIGRPHHAAVQHAGHAHVVDINRVRRSPSPADRCAAPIARRWCRR